jgi:multidrug efflux pump subunit AcrA (membrane-fusion protein)
MKSWISAVLLLALSITFFGCSNSSDSEKTSASKGAKPRAEAKEEKQERAARIRPAVPVKVSEVDEGTITSSLVFDSVLETESSVEIFAETSGLILEVHVEEGDRVVAGQVLALMENV